MAAGVSTRPGRDIWRAELALSGRRHRSASTRRCPRGDEKFARAQRLSRALSDQLREGAGRRRHGQHAGAGRVGLPAASLQRRIRHRRSARPAPDGGRNGRRRSTGRPVHQHAARADRVVDDDAQIDERVAHPAHPADCAAALRAHAAGRRPGVSGVAREPRCAESMVVFDYLTPLDSVSAAAGAPLRVHRADQLSAGAAGLRRRGDAAAPRYSAERFTEAAIERCSPIWRDRADAVSAGTRPTFANDPVDEAERVLLVGEGETRVRHGRGPAHDSFTPPGPGHPERDRPAHGHPHRPDHPHFTPN